MAAEEATDPEACSASKRIRIRDSDSDSDEDVVHDMKMEELDETNRGNNNNNNNSNNINNNIDNNNNNNIHNNGNNDVVCVDIAPTIYQVTGIIDNLPQYKINDIDGKSFAKYLFNQSNSNSNVYSSQLQAKEESKQEESKEDEWKDMLLFEYIWIGNTTFGNYNVWYPSNESFMGINKTPPKFNSKTGNIYWIDNSYQSSFSGLRIINETMNISYAEYITGTYTQDDFDNSLWFELYNLTKDPFQMNNIYFLRLGFGWMQGLFCFFVWLGARMFGLLILLFHCVVGARMNHECLGTFFFELLSFF